MLVTPNPTRLTFFKKHQSKTFKNLSQWNGGIANDNTFFSNSQSNWELLPINWLNLETSIKHKGLDWQHGQGRQPTAHTRWATEYERRSRGGLVFETW